MQFSGTLQALKSAVGCALLASLLAACGGGGGSGAESTATSPTPAPDGGGTGTPPPADPPPAAPPPPPPPNDPPPANPPPAPAPPPEPAPTEEPATSPGPGQTVSERVVSTRTAASYDLKIHLPPSYDGNAAKYPVIYALDGDADFNNGGTRFETFKAVLERKGIGAILVGIGGSARRDIDYIFPGARPYHEFLTTELVPFIDSKYRTDAKRRILTGLSLSGSMAGHALLMEGAAGTLTFSHFLSTEGSYDWQPAETIGLEQQMYDTQRGKPIRATLFLARCGDTTNCNFVPVGNLYDRLLQRGYPEFTVVEKTYATGHTDADVPAFEDAMTAIFNK